MKVKYPKIDLRVRCHWVSKTTGEIIRTSCAWPLQICATSTW